MHNVGQYLLFAALGILAGGVGVVFTRVLYLIEDARDWTWTTALRAPEWLRPAAGGLLLGGLLLALPELYGVGYPVLGNGIADKYTIAFLLTLLAGKILATSLTIGIGGSGGVFAPSLFIGAMLGSAYGQTLHHVVPHLGSVRSRASNWCALCCPPYVPPRATYAMLAMCRSPKVPSDAAASAEAQGEKLAPGCVQGESSAAQQRVQRQRPADDASQSRRRVGRRAQTRTYS